MIISASFSKPTKLCEEKFSKKYLRAKAKLNSSQSSKEYSIEFFTEKQTFHAHFSSEELNTFIEENAGHRKRLSSASGALLSERA